MIARVVHVESSAPDVATLDGKGSRSRREGRDSIGIRGGHGGDGLKPTTLRQNVQVTVQRTRLAG